MLHDAVFICTYPSNVVVILFISENYYQQFSLKHAKANMSFEWMRAYQLIQAKL